MKVQRYEGHHGSLLSRSPHQHGSGPPTIFKDGTPQLQSRSATHTSRRSYSTSCCVSLQLGVSVIPQATQKREQQAAQMCLATSLRPEHQDMKCRSWRMQAATAAIWGESCQGRLCCNRESPDDIHSMVLGIKEGLTFTTLPPELGMA